jgi:hypothetical protein
VITPPRLAATIERRLLVNYRVDPGVARALLPEGLRPQLVDGSAVAGICLLRLGDLRPAWFAPRIGWGAENAAHRVAVEWDDADGVRTGVYIPERHTASRLAVVAGGRVFPGRHRHARFDSVETPDRIRVSLESPATRVHADVRTTDDWSSSLFPTLADASAFFRNGSVGWSPALDGRGLEGIRLATDSWAVRAAEPTSVESSFFDSLPAGSAVLDDVLLMRDVPVTWNAPGVRAPRPGARA